MIHDNFKTYYEKNRPTETAFIIYGAAVPTGGKEQLKQLLELTHSHFNGSIEHDLNPLIGKETITIGDRIEWERRQAFSDFVWEYDFYMAVHDMLIIANAFTGVDYDLLKCFKLEKKLYAKLTNFEQKSAVSDKTLSLLETVLLGIYEERR